MKFTFYLSEKHRDKSNIESSKNLEGHNHDKQCTGKVRKCIPSGFYAGDLLPLATVFANLQNLGEVRGENKNNVKEQKRSRAVPK